MHHNAIQDTLFDAAQSAALAPTREAPGMVADSQSRPPDILLPTWCCGCPAALDVHVISPLQDLTVHEAAITPGYAFSVGVRHKLTAHLANYHAAGIDFIPIVAEYLGGLAEDTIFMVRAIGKAVSHRTTIDIPSISISQLFHRLAISLWRGNARLWLNRHPTLSPLVDSVI